MFLATLRFSSILPGAILIVLTTTLHAAAYDENSAAQAVARKDNEQWTKRHQSLVDLSKKGDSEVVFLGDSAIQGWEGAGREPWKKHFEPLKAANYGIGGDRTQNVLWRITKGKELDGQKARLYVVVIGTNNVRDNSADDIAEGVTAIVKELNRQKPDAKVLLLGVFPRGNTSSDMFRAKIKELNKTLAMLESKQVHVLDIGEKFLDKEGSLAEDISKDALHLTPKGYTIWAETIAPVVTEMLKK
jgi:lysophospholipase L1-like esterase